MQINNPSTNKKPKQQQQNVSAKVTDYRKNTKPLMEKRRRERINRSLEELKNLILDQTSHNNVSLLLLLFIVIHLTMLDPGVSFYFFKKFFNL